MTENYSWIWNNYLRKKTKKQKAKAWKLAEPPLHIGQMRGKPNCSREKRLRQNSAVNQTSSTATHNQEGTQNMQLSPEEQRVYTPHWALQVVKPAPERSAPKIFGFKDHQPQEIWETGVNRGTALKALQCRLTCPHAQCRSTLWKVPNFLYEEDSYANFTALVQWVAACWDTVWAQRLVGVIFLSSDRNHHFFLFPFSFPVSANFMRQLDGKYKEIQLDLTFENC